MKKIKQVGMVFVLVLLMGSSVFATTTKEEQKIVIEEDSSDKEVILMEDIALEKQITLIENRPLEYDIEPYLEDPMELEDFVKIIYHAKRNNQNIMKVNYSSENKHYAIENGTIKVSYVEMLRDVLDYLRSLYPEYFFNEKVQSVNYVTTGHGIYVVIDISSYEFDDEKVDILRDFLFSETLEIAKEMVDTGFINVEMSEKDIALRLNSWICEKLEYDNSFNDLSYTGYGALKNEKAVCLGYVILYNRMLSLFGIQVTGVIGYGDGGLHIWSEAILDGEKFYIDTTWNDKGVYASREHFTNDKEKFQYNRTWDEEFYNKYKGMELANKSEEEINEIASEEKTNEVKFKLRKFN